METTKTTRIDSLSVKCPKCGAVAGAPCVTPAGRTIGGGKGPSAHRSRYYAAARAAEIASASEWVDGFANNLVAAFDHAGKIAEGK